MEACCDMLRRGSFHTYFEHGANACPSYHLSSFLSTKNAGLKVIIPVDDSVEAKDVVYRIGEESEDPMRGPSLELGYREKGEDGKMQENLIIDGQILNTIRRFTVKFGFSGVAMFLGDWGDWWLLWLGMSL